MKISAFVSFIQKTYTLQGFETSHFHDCSFSTGFAHCPICGVAKTYTTIRTGSFHVSPEQVLNFCLNLFDRNLSRCMAYHFRGNHSCQHVFVTSLRKLKNFICWLVEVLLFIDPLVKSGLFQVITGVLAELESGQGQQSFLEKICD